MNALSRRHFLALGCAAAAAPLVTPLTLAAAPGDNRLVVIILRGGMDGLGVFAPWGSGNGPGFAPKPGRCRIRG